MKKNRVGWSRGQGQRPEVQPCTITASLAPSALLPRQVSALRSSARPFPIQQKLQTLSLRIGSRGCAVMFEALVDVAVVAVVASIVQLFDFSTTVVRNDEACQHV
jgi:hypothetical protein